jgi:hypothetical protein
MFFALEEDGDDEISVPTFMFSSLGQKLAKLL